MVTSKQPARNSDGKFAELIQLAREGDRRAMGDLMQGCREYLLLVANRDLDQDLRPKVGASDVVQETMITAQAAFEHFDGTSREELLAWLRAILKNDLRGAYRHFKGFQKRDIDRESPLADGSRQIPVDPQDTPSTRAAIDEERRILQEAMAALSDQDNQVLRLRNWKKLSFAEIGNEMHRSEDAARKLWGRAVLRLQQALKNRQQD